MENIDHNRTKSEISSVPPGISETSMITLTTVNTVLAICCIVLSVLMGYYRLKSRATKHLVHVLYLLNGLVDLLVGLGFLLQSPALCSIIREGRNYSDRTVPACISYFVAALSVKMSVYMNCVLGVVRCIGIVLPFYSISRKTLVVSTVVYLLAWLLILSLDLYRFNVTGEGGFTVDSIVMTSQPGFGMLLLIIANHRDKVGISFLVYHLGNLVRFVIPTVLPTVLCLVLVVIQLCHMPRKDPRVGSCRATGYRARQDDNEAQTISKASVTILLLTMIFVITSLVSLFVWLALAGVNGFLFSKSKFEGLVMARKQGFTWSDRVVQYFCMSTCALVCSTLSPLTLLLRGTGTALSPARKFLYRLTWWGR